MPRTICAIYCRLSNQRADSVSVERRKTQKEKQVEALARELAAAGVSDALQRQVLGQVVKQLPPDGLRPSPDPPAAVRRLPALDPLVALLSDLPARLANPTADPAAVNRTLRDILARVDVDGRTLHFHPWPEYAALFRSIG